MANRPAELRVGKVEWSAQQDGETLKVDPSPHVATTLDGIRRPCEHRFDGRQRATGAVGVQFWVTVDAAQDDQTWRSRPDVHDCLVRARDAIGGLFDVRHPSLRDTVLASLDDWVHAATVPPPVRGSHTADDDVVFGLSSGGDRHCVLVGLIHRRRSEDGTWRELGASVIIVAGPDRYGVRLRVGGPAKRGVMLLPNAPIALDIGLPVTALVRAVDELDGACRALETEVAQVLSTRGEPDSRAHLGEIHRLLVDRAELELRHRRFEEVRRGLATAWRAQTFRLDDRTGAALADAADRLELVRAKLIDVPQLYLAASSWRQAARTEVLSTAVAALAPPALIAGALGANLLPWEDPTSAMPFAGMLLLMASSALAAAVVARFAFFGAGGLRTRLTTLRATLIALSLVGILAGGWLLLDGTTVR